MTNKRTIDYELVPSRKVTFGKSRQDDWAAEPVALDYGMLLICRGGEATLRVNFNDYALREHSVLLLFPNDVVLLQTATPDFLVERLRYDPALLREASLQMEHTVYSQLRADRCFDNSQTVAELVSTMFTMLRIYFQRKDCQCLEQISTLQLKAFFIGYYDYRSRCPNQHPDEQGSPRMRELFGLFMRLLEEKYRESRDVNYYAALMHITPKYLNAIVSHVTQHRVKTVIDHYVILQLKLTLKNSTSSVKEIAWDYHFSDLSFFCRYFKQHTGQTPQEFRRLNVLKR